MGHVLSKLLLLYVTLVQFYDVFAARYFKTDLVSARFPRLNQFFPTLNARQLAVGCRTKTPGIVPRQWSYSEENEAR